ncbi:MAG: glutamate--tRNA ligase [Oscillospiraceae bacterium]|nr:glutamate--tRNA ligase [Oscillospiraceae bacterium]
MNTDKKVRTRFAPSPTGYMHIGNLRTAIYTYLIARKYGGDFILRIEDTDQGRYVEGATEKIYDTLRVCGLNWDEGPDIGGPVGPYVQSERMGIFKEYAEKLVESGHAYYCFCTKERIDEMHRKQQEAKVSNMMYDRHCRELPKEEVDRLLAEGVPYVIRQKIPTEGTTTFTDVLYGDITVENSTLDDQILLKADGMPTYNFANVVDDHLMGITHVVRGNEYLSSTPKYNLLYEAFGWEIPQYIHVEHIMRDAKHKLSKRDGDAYFGDFVEKGYLVPAIMNYIALLGWAPKGENEIFSLEELVNEFDINGLSKSPAVFDPDKMKAINAEYIRRMTHDEFKAVAMPYIRQTVKREDADFDTLLEALQPRTELLTEIPEKVDFIDEMPEYSDELYFNKKMKTNAETGLEALKMILPVLESVEDWNSENVHSALFAEIEKQGVKNGWMLWPLRVALSGKAMTPGGGVELCAVLGKDESVKRIKAAIEKLSA